MGSRAVVSAGVADSTDTAPGRGGVRGRVAKLLERRLLDLPDPLDGEPEIGADPAQRLRGLAESVMAPQHGALARVELVGERPHDLDLHPVEYVLVLALGDGVDDRLAERRARVLVGARRLLERARHLI